MLFPICHIHVVPDAVPDMCSLLFFNQYSILPSFNLNEMQYQGMMVFINLPNTQIPVGGAWPKTVLLHASK